MKYKYLIILLFFLLVTKTKHRNLAISYSFFSWFLAIETSKNNFSFEPSFFYSPFGKLLPANKKGCVSGVSMWESRYQMWRNEEICDALFKEMGLLNKVFCQFRLCLIYLLVGFYFCYYYLVFGGNFIIIIIIWFVCFWLSNRLLWLAHWAITEGEKRDRAFDIFKIDTLYSFHLASLYRFQEFSKDMG